MVRLVAVPLGTLVVALGMLACSSSDDRAAGRSPSARAGSTATSTGTVVALPSPQTEGGMSLADALATRRSVRGFTDEPLSTEQISQLLWSAQGITADWGGRTAPSAGALYPLEVYVVTAGGASHYLPEGHRLEILSGADLRGPLAAAAHGQSAVADAPVVFVIAGVTSRTSAKYGERAERYVQLEAGHACQNLLLQAVALDLGGVPMGAFADSEVRSVLGLPSGQAPLYLVPVGHPSDDE
jgi:SagB-type dehydrogenase family enzyme